MKYCNECHRLSRDDDFCSHCGAAVYGNDNASGGNISCDTISGHVHEQQSFSGRNDSQPKKGTGCVTVIVVIFVLNFIISVLGALSDQ